MKNEIKEIDRLANLEGNLPEEVWRARYLQIKTAQSASEIIKTFMRREKIYIAALIFLAALAFYFAAKQMRKVEVRFSKPVSPIGNFVVPDKNDIWQKKL